MKEAAINLTHPASVAFDTVKTSQQLVSKTVSVIATLTGASRTTVADVRITEPYTTSMQAGLVLQHNKSTPITVSLAPSSLTNDGLVKGSLEFSLDSCATKYRIDLSATNVVVSIDAEDETEFEAVSIDGVLFARTGEGVVHVYDARGGLVSKSVTAASENGVRRQIVDNLPSGVYVVMYQSMPAGVQQARTVVVYR
jgi:hypothetical protein